MTLLSPPSTSPPPPGGGVLVWKRVWEITFFGLKYGQDLEKRVATPHQEFPGVPSQEQAPQLINPFMSQKSPILIFSLQIHNQ